MTISEETKSKVFAQYLGQKVITRLRGYNLEEKRTSTFKTGKLMNVDMAMAVNKIGVLLDEEKVPENLVHMEAGTDCRLELKPLTEITEEDCLELCKIRGYVKEHQTVINGKVLVSNLIDQEAAGGITSWQEYQYLQSKGYDLPQYLLNWKTLKYCDLAAYEPGQKNEAKPLL